MAKLIEKPSFAAPDQEIGDVTLSGIAEGQVTSIAPFRGQEAAVSARLVAEFGVGLPDVGTHIAAVDIRLVWAGRGRGLLIGAPPPDLGGLAATTDQTGAEAVMGVAGSTAHHVLARLVPIDLRADVFGANATARTMLGHMSATISRIGAEAFEVRVMRSMAGTLHHEVTQAATLFAARTAR